MKIGEALIREGLITRDHLTRALERQVMFGGRIDTNLVELRFLQEENLAKFLGRYFRTPAVQPEMLVSISEEVLSSLDRALVEKYKVLPFWKERKRLSAAMMNPADIKTIEELRFVTGYDIIPYVITEKRLLFALEKYYGIKRESQRIAFTDPHTPVTTAEENDSFEGIKASFAEVKSTEEVAAMLLSEAYRTARRVAIFTMRSGCRIVGWRARGLSVDTFETSGKESSIFSEVLKTGSYYRGPLLSMKGNEPLIASLAGVPRDVLLMPVILREKVVAFLYADNGNDAVLDANISYVSKLASMAALAFEIIILRKRILEI